MCRQQEVSRTITGTSQVECEGTVPDWQAFDDHHLLGLDPQRWYPYFPERRDSHQFHISKLPPPLSLDYLFVSDSLAMLRLRDATPVLADLTLQLETAEVGSREANGSTQMRKGAWQAPDGATFTTSGDTISAHPPWKVPGSGEAFARYHWTVPRETRIFFASEVALDPGAVGDGRSDGVTFIARHGTTRIKRALRTIRRRLHLITWNSI